jgi:hypothetical protein
MDPWHATYEQVEADLGDRGYTAEAGTVMDQAQREPGQLAFTRDLQAWAAYREVDGTWLTGSGLQHQPEPLPEAEPEMEAGR